MYTMIHLLQASWPLGRICCHLAFIWVTKGFEQKKVDQNRTTGSVCTDTQTHRHTDTQHGSSYMPVTLYYYSIIIRDGPKRTKYAKFLRMTVCVDVLPLPQS